MIDLRLQEAARRGPDGHDYQLALHAWFKLPVMASVADKDVGAIRISIKQREPWLMKNLMVGPI